MSADPQITLSYPANLIALPCPTLLPLYFCQYFIGKRGAQRRARRGNPAADRNMPLVSYSRPVVQEWGRFFTAGIFTCEDEFSFCRKG